MATSICSIYSPVDFTPTDPENITPIEDYYMNRPISPEDIEFINRPQIKDTRICSQHPLLRTQPEPIQKPPTLPTQVSKPPKSDIELVSIVGDNYFLNLSKSDYIKFKSTERYKSLLDSEKTRLPLIRKRYKAKIASKKYREGSKAELNKLLNMTVSWEERNAYLERQIKILQEHCKKLIKGKN